MQRIRRSILVTGRVQGVGFRFFTHKCAVSLNCTGWVRNTPDGGVAMEVQGSSAQVEAFVDKISQGPMLAHVNNVTATELPVDEGEKRFAVRY